MATGKQGVEVAADGIVEIRIKPATDFRGFKRIFRSWALSHS